MHSDIPQKSIQLRMNLEKSEKAVTTAAESYEPSVVARYLISLCTDFNKFYQECPILKDENESIKIARLQLVNVASQIIKDATALLGMECPEEM